MDGQWECERLDEMLFRVFRAQAEKHLPTLRQMWAAITATVRNPQTPRRAFKVGEQHYDIISAFIKSIRGSDPNAAVYYLARMVEGGEDVKFIARRMLILASTSSKAKIRIPTSGLASPRSSSTSIAKLRS